MSELKIDKVSPRSGTYVSLNTVGMKNIIINGDMSIAQRGTSATGLGNGDTGYHTVDRFKFVENNAPTCEFTQTQSTDVPSGQGFATSLKMDCTTAQGSLAGDDFIYINTSAEGQNLQYLKKGTANAESTTLSFWVKSNKTGTYIFEIIDRDNDRAISKSYTISLASTWEKKTITLDGDTTGALDNDNARSFEIIFWLLAGANFQSGTLQTSWNTRTTTNDAVGQVNLADDTANEWYITGVQLEAGTTASDFEFLPVDVNLQRCYRYCYRVNGNSTDDQMFGAIGFFGTTSRADVMMSFNPPMRTVPTVTEGIINVIPPGSNASLSAVFDDNEPNDCVALGVNFTADSGTPFTANQTAIPRISANASGFIQFDAEL
jgi:hypothetical protein